jgi:hypothetical protein
MSSAKEAAKETATEHQTSAALDPTQPSTKNSKKISKEVGQTETKLTPAIERIVNGVFTKHPSATLLQLRHHIERKTRAH